ncbi:MAG TPA: GH36 C-terminal domain-containing protein, partial [Vicinamibacterales bacterium]|nr:GH36 C-terminal domain-containing protein [Vicinamibacterales bacterium]
PPWDAIQELRPDSGEAIIFGFQNDSAVENIAVRPRGLDPDAMYEIAPVDGGRTRTATGAELLAGLDIDPSFESAARVIRLRPIGRATVPASINRSKRDEQADEQRVKMRRHDDDHLAHPR